MFDFCDSISSPGSSDFSDIPLLQVEHLCYQCMQPAAYLFDDGRCCYCTRLLPDEVIGSVYEHSPVYLDDEITVLLDAAFGVPDLPPCSDLTRQYRSIGNSSIVSVGRY